MDSFLNFIIELIYQNNTYQSRNTLSLNMVDTILILYFMKVQLYMFWNKKTGSSIVFEPEKNIKQYTQGSAVTRSVGAPGQTLWMGPLCWERGWWGLNLGATAPQRRKWEYGNHSTNIAISIHNLQIFLERIDWKQTKTEIAKLCRQIFLVNPYLTLYLHSNGRWGIVIVYLVITILLEHRTIGPLIPR